MSPETALDVVRPKHIPEFVCDQDVHGWICGRIAPRDSWVLREKSHLREWEVHFFVLQFQKKTELSTGLSMVRTFFQRMIRTRRSGPQAQKCMFVWLE